LLASLLLPVPSQLRQPAAAACLHHLLLLPLTRCRFLVLWLVWSVLGHEHTQLCSQV
jgi:hypothetical protein